MINKKSRLEVNDTPKFNTKVQDISSPAPPPTLNILPLFEKKSNKEKVEIPPPPVEKKRNKPKEKVEIPPPLVEKKRNKPKEKVEIPPLPVEKKRNKPKEKVAIPPPLVEKTRNKPKEPPQFNNKNNDDFELNYEAVFQNNNQILPLAVNSGVTSTASIVSAQTFVIAPEAKPIPIDAALLSDGNSQDDNASNEDGSIVSELTCFGCQTILDEDEPFIECVKCSDIYHISCAEMTEDNICTACRDEEEDNIISLQNNTSSNESSASNYATTVTLSGGSVSSSDFILSLLKWKECLNNPKTEWSMIEFQDWLRNGGYGQDSRRDKNESIADAISRNLNINEDQIKKLNKMVPVLTLTRQMEKKFPILFQKEIMSLEYEGYLFTATVFYIPLIQNLVNLLQSPMMKRCPFYSPTVQNTCPSLSQSGSLQKSIVENFNVGNDDIPLFVDGMWDGTVTTLAKIIPVWIRFSHADSYYQLRHNESNSLLCLLLPSKSSLSVSNLDGTKISIKTLKKNNNEGLSLITSVLRKFERNALKKFIFDPIKMTQDRKVRFEVDGQHKTLILFVGTISVDIEQRWKDLGNLPGKFPCTFCYARSSCANDCPCANQTRRNPGFDSYLRSQPNKEVLTQHGIKETEVCAMKLSDVYLMPGFGPSSNYCIDLLHCLEAIIKIYEHVLADYGEDLINLSRKFGNGTFGVANSVSFHIKEDNLKDFSGIIMAMLFLPYSLIKNKITPAKHQANVKLVLSLFKIIVLVKDDAPGLLLDEIDTAVAAFRQACEICEQNEGNVLKETVKLHEIKCHLRECIELHGGLRRLSTASIEYLHDPVKKQFKKSSLRPVECDLKVLKLMTYRRIMKNVELLSLPEINQHANFLPEFSFEIHPFGKDLFAILNENFKQVAKIFRVEGVFSNTHTFGSSFFNDLEDSEVFGNSASLSIKCGSRNENIRNPTKIFVPLRSYSHYYCIGYKNDDDEIPGSDVCKEEFCLHHSDLQLNSSFCRRKNTSFAIPLLFIRDYAVCVQLTKLAIPDELQKKSLKNNDKLFESIYSFVKFTEDIIRVDLALVRGNFRFIQITNFNNLFVVELGNNYFQTSSYNKI